MFDFKHSGGANSDRQWWLRFRCEEFWPRPITLPPLEVLLRFTIAINVSVCMPVSQHISKTILLVHVVHILWPGHSLAVLRYVMCFRFCVAFAQARQKWRTLQATHQGHHRREIGCLRLRRYLFVWYLRGTFFMNRWLINHVTCDVGEASGVVIGRSAGGRRCREEFVDSDWFRRAGRVTCLRHSKVWRHQSTCTL